MNVLVIPEDFTKDQHVLAVLVRAMCADLGKDRAKVRVCLDPRFHGVGDALDESKLKSVVLANPMVDLFLLCVDRDDESGRRTRLDQLEAKLQGEVKKVGGRFLGENAWQELEVWTLAGHNLPSGWQWSAVRGERDPKERYFEPLARLRGIHEEADGGRKKLSEEAARRFGRVRRLCREDVQVLHARIGAWLAGNAVPDHATALASLK